MQFGIILNGVLTQWVRNIVPGNLIKIFTKKELYQTYEIGSNYFSSNTSSLFCDKIM